MPSKGVAMTMPTRPWYHKPGWWIGLGCLGCLGVPVVGIVLFGLLFGAARDEARSRIDDKARATSTLTLADQIREGPCVLVLWAFTNEGYEDNMFSQPAPGNVFSMTRVAVHNYGYDEAPVNEFGFTLKADNGVGYGSNPISPMVTRRLPSVSLADGAWEWGYLGFEVSEESTGGHLECAGMRRIVLAHDDPDTRESLREVGIEVPASVMPPPKASSP